MLAVWLQFTLLVTGSLAQSGSKVCTVESSATKDDSPAFQAALEKCKTNGIIVFKEGVNYNIWSPIKSPKLDKVEIRILGNLHLPKNITRVQQIVRSSGSTWITITGRRVNWTGSESAANGWINSYGEQWWDANPRGKTGLPDRPHLLLWAPSDSVLLRFKSRKPIGWNVGVAGDNVLVDGAEIDASAAPGRGFPFNTDGFGVTGRHVEIRRSRIYNGDDAITMQQGARDVLVRDCDIGYETHGLSIGSLRGSAAKPAAVADIVFRNVTVHGGLYAARFKSWKNGRGLVTNVTWEDIRVTNVTFPVFVTQTYTNQANGRDTSTSAATSAVNMRGFRWRRISGTINAQTPGDGSCATPPRCWYYDGLPAALRHTEAVIIQCGTRTSCRDFELSGIDLRPLGGAAAAAVCENVTPELNPRLGFVCANGAFRAT